MRNLMKASQLLLVTCFVVLSACKKNASEEKTDEILSKELAGKVTGWLEKRKSNSSEEVKLNIQTLQNNLSLDKLWVETNNKKEQFIIVPINSNFKTKIDKDKQHADYLVMLLNDVSQISKANIIQYIPKDGINSLIPKNAASAIFRSKEVNCEGTFTVLTISGRFYYRLKFEAGKLHSATEMKSKPQNADGGRTASDCIAWYLVTTIYFWDGTTEVTRDYLGTTCGDSCLDGMGQNTCDSEGGGSSGGDPQIEYEYATVRSVNWRVYTSPDNLNKVLSNEYLKGTRRPNNGSTFSEIEHTDDDVNNTMAFGHSSYATWHKDFWSRAFTADYKQGTVRSHIRQTDIS
jgi:hypothetical protein